MGKKKLLFLFNPYSGTGAIKSQLFYVVDIFTKAGYEVTIYPTQCSGDATKQVLELAAGFDRIVCSGGDGTLDEVVTGLMKAGLQVPLGYIPAGSTNDFARSLGINKNARAAAKIAAGDKNFLCDIGRFDDDYFVYIAAFGLLTEVSYKTSQDIKNILGHVAYILEGAKDIFNITTHHLRVEYGSEYIEDEFIFGMITNTHSVGGIKDIIPGDVSLNDGLFEVTLIKRPIDLIQLADILSYLQGFNKSSKFVYSFQASSLRIHSSSELPWTLDGEFGGDRRTVVVENCHNAINFLVE